MNPRVVCFALLACSAAALDSSHKAVLSGSSDGRRTEVPQRATTASSSNDDSHDSSLESGDGKA